MLRSGNPPPPLLHTWSPWIENVGSIYWKKKKKSCIELHYNGCVHYCSVYTVNLGEMCWCSPHKVGQLYQNKKGWLNVVTVQPVQQRRAIMSGLHQPIITLQSDSQHPPDRRRGEVGTRLLPPQHYLQRPLLIYYLGFWPGRVLYPYHLTYNINILV